MSVKGYGGLDGEKDFGDSRRCYREIDYKDKSKKRGISIKTSVVNSTKKF